MSVDGVVYYRVQNATLAVANITNADAATRLLAQTTLRNVLGTKNLAEILSDREEIAHSMQVDTQLPLPPSCTEMFSGKACSVSICKHTQTFFYIKPSFLSHSFFSS